MSFNTCLFTFLSILAFVKSDCQLPSIPEGAFAIPNNNTIFEENASIEVICSNDEDFKISLQCIRGLWEGCWNCLRCGDKQSGILRTFRIFYPYRKNNHHIFYDENFNNEQEVDQKIHLTLLTYFSKKQAWRFFFKNPLTDIFKIRFTMEMEEDVYEAFVDNLEDNQLKMRVQNSDCDIKVKQMLHVEFAQLSRIVTYESICNSTELGNEVSYFTLRCEDVGEGNVVIKNIELWSNPATCGEPPAFVGYRNHQVEDGIYSYQCTDGYENATTADNLECDANRIWSSQNYSQFLPKCVPQISCPLIDNAAFNISYSNLFYSTEEAFAVSDTQAKLQCQAPNTMLIGQQSIICKDGKWSNDIPKCVEEVFVDNEIAASDIATVSTSIPTPEFSAASTTISETLEGNSITEHFEESSSGDDEINTETSNESIHETTTQNLIVESAEKRAEPSPGVTVVIVMLSLGILIIIIVSTVSYYRKRMHSESAKIKNPIFTVTNSDNESNMKSDIQKNPLNGQIGESSSYINLKSNSLETLNCNAIVVGGTLKDENNNEGETNIEQENNVEFSNHVDIITSV